MLSALHVEKCVAQHLSLPDFAGPLNSPQLTAGLSAILPNESLSKDHYELCKAEITHSCFHFRITNLLARLEGPHFVYRKTSGAFGEFNIQLNLHRN